jgi:hypothetical protein
LPDGRGTATEKGKPAIATKVPFPDKSRNDFFDF